MSYERSRQTDQVWFKGVFISCEGCGDEAVGINTCCQISADHAATFTSPHQDGSIIATQPIKGEVLHPVTPMQYLLTNHS